MSLSYSNALIVAIGKKPHTALVLNDNEVIDTMAACWNHCEDVLDMVETKKAAHGDPDNQLFGITEHVAWYLHR